MADFTREWDVGSVAQAFRRGVRLIRRSPAGVVRDEAEIEIVMDDGVSAATVVVDIDELDPADKAAGLQFAAAVHALAVTKVQVKDIR